MSSNEGSLPFDLPTLFGYTEAISQPRHEKPLDTIQGVDRREG
jgi:hypothetical protein